MQKRATTSKNIYTETSTVLASDMFDWFLKKDFDKNEICYLKRKKTHTQ